MELNLGWCSSVGPYGAKHSLQLAPLRTCINRMWNESARLSWYETVRLLLEKRCHWEGRRGQRDSGGKSRKARKTWPERLHLKTKNRLKEAPNQRPSHPLPSTTPNDEHRHSKQLLPLPILLIPTTCSMTLSSADLPACAPCYLALYTPLTAPSPRRLRKLVARELRLNLTRSSISKLSLQPRSQSTSNDALAWACRLLYVVGASLAESVGAVRPPGSYSPQHSHQDSTGSR
jgi:hypothetical protein